MLSATTTAVLAVRSGLRSIEINAKRYDHWRTVLAARNGKTKHWREGILQYFPQLLGATLSDEDVAVFMWQWLLDSQQYPERLCRVHPINIIRMEENTIKLFVNKLPINEQHWPCTYCDQDCTLLERAGACADRNVFLRKTTPGLGPNHGYNEDCSLHFGGPLLAHDPLSCLQISLSKAARSRVRQGSTMAPRRSVTEYHRSEVRSILHPRGWGATAMSEIEESIIDVLDSRMCGAITNTATLTQKQLECTTPAIFVLETEAERYRSLSGLSVSDNCGSSDCVTTGESNILAQSVACLPSELRVSESIPDMAEKCIFSEIWVYHFTMINKRLGSGCCACPSLKVDYKAYEVTTDLDIR
uniref:Uncharacterized protein n=1 Tax=Timema poppense TaxID=170557 RepID=A0A7R9CWE2_TIMPO|nr:unnamed protein product [Timema poppensis]